VENNQFVEAGTLLLELDPLDYEAELGHAKANLDTRSAEARSALPGVTFTVPARTIPRGMTVSAECFPKSWMSSKHPDQWSIDAFRCCAARRENPLPVPSRRPRA
jgi:hypothetical protein